MALTEILASLRDLGVERDDDLVARTRGGRDGVGLERVLDIVVGVQVDEVSVGSGARGGGGGGGGETELDAVEGVKEVGIGVLLRREKDTRGREGSARASNEREEKAEKAAAD